MPYDGVIVSEAYASYYFLQLPTPAAVNDSDRVWAIRAFARAQWAALTAALLGVIAMICYPGGTGLEHTTTRYRLTQNFLSDLGMTVAHNGHSNRVGASLFVISIIVLIIGFGVAMRWFIRLCSNSQTSRNLARAAGVVGLLVCLSFVGVALTPENAVMGLHVQFTLFAFRVFPVACVLLLLAAHKSGVFSTRVLIAWTIGTACLTAYAVFLIVGPSPETPNGLVACVIVQKSVVSTIVVSLMYVCRETARALRFATETPHSQTKL